VLDSVSVPGLLLSVTGVKGEDDLHGMSQAKPGYLLRNQTPPTFSFFSYTVRSMFRSLSGILSIIISQGFGLPPSFPLRRGTLT
jgi:hypothetical protein